MTTLKQKQKTLDTINNRIDDYILKGAFNTVKCRELRRLHKQITYDISDLQNGFYIKPIA